METITGIVERISYQNDSNGFTIAKLQCRESSNLIAIVGTMPGLRPGETITCRGTWKTHISYGKQFEVESYRSDKPADIEGIRKYLGSGLIKGIGPVYADRIVAAFGTETLDILESAPERLLEVAGLGKKRCGQLVASWAEQKNIRDVMIFLQSHGVTSGYAQKIFRCYGAESIARLKSNPYSLARDIKGIGFKVADQIAQRLGLAFNAVERLDAGIEFALEEAASEGHVCYPAHELTLLASSLLKVEAPSLQSRLDHLIDGGRLIRFDLVQEGKGVPYLWLKGFFLAETGVAKELLRLKKSSCSLRPVHLDKALQWVQEHLKLTLAPNQLQAVKVALSEKVQVITGGPGTGKSTITRAILAVTQKLTDKIVLAAPTGRAAKRLSSITGMPAKTIHSLLEWDFKALAFKKNRKTPLDCDLLIVDESSMIDVFLMYHLLKALPDHARVVFVGDVNQLPSVGPGNVLKDIIASGAFPVTSLVEIFRQAAGSRIIMNAHNINMGRMPDLTNSSDGDFFFINAETPEEVLRHIITLVRERLPRKYKLDSLQDVQVMAPMKRGIVGIDNLNAELQKALIGDKPSIQRYGRHYRQGDKVMQIRNNYRKEVFNGNIGFILEIDEAKEQLSVKYEERTALYTFHELDELVLAYAVSVHKYQGCECYCVILVVHTSHFKLLQRNLLYTGVTRGRRLVILVGNPKAVAIATHNDEVKCRHTGLRQAIEGTCLLRFI